MVKRSVQIGVGDVFTREGVDHFFYVRLTAGLTITIPEDDEQQFEVGEFVNVGPAPVYEIVRI